MRRILSILFILASFTATSQTVQTIGAPGTRVNSRGDFISDSIFYLPRTQVTSRTPFQSGAIRYQASDSSIYQWTGTAWRKISGTVDSLLFSTRAWRQKGDDSLAAIINTRTDTVNLLSTKAWRQKGIESVAALSRVGGSGTINRVPKFTAAGTIGDGSIADSSTSVRMTILSAGNIGINTSTPSQRLEVSGNLLVSSGSIFVNTSGQPIRISNFYGSGSNGNNVWIGGGGTSSGTGGGAVSNGSTNTAIGVSAMNANTTGNQNVAVGFQSLIANTTGGSNSVVGHNAMQANTSGNSNNAIGLNALFSNTTGSNNVSIGNSSINANTTGTDNTGIGHAVLLNTVTGGSNVGLGSNAGRRIENGNGLTNTSNSIYIGVDARAKLDSNTNEVVIGYNGRGNGSNTTTLGNSSTVGTYIPAGESYFGTTSDAGDYRVQVAGSIYSTTGAVLAVSSGNVGIGTATPNVSYKFDVVGGDILVRGLRIGRGLADISSNTAAGVNALNSTTSATSSTGIGNSALSALTTGIQNTGIGSDAGASLTSGASNTLLGMNAGNKLTTANENVAIGYLSMYDNTAGASNTIIGVAAMYGLRTSNNVAVGQNAGRWVAPGTSTAADSVTNSIYIGYQARAGSKTATNEISIGNNALGNGSNTVTIGNSSTTDNYFFGALRTSAPPGGTAAAWRLGTVATVTPTSPNRTIEVSIGGTIYYIHAKTTND